MSLVLSAVRSSGTDSRRTRNSSLSLVTDRYPRYDGSCLAASAVRDLVQARLAPLSRRRERGEEVPAGVGVRQGSCCKLMSLVSKGKKHADALHLPRSMTFSSRRLTTSRLGRESLCHRQRSCPLTAAPLAGQLPSTPTSLVADPPTSSLPSTSSPPRTSAQSSPPRPSLLQSSPSSGLFSSRPSTPFSDRSPTSSSSHSPRIRLPRRLRSGTSPPSLSATSTESARD
jgi:hypothetical protein